ncbi:hypothetical protein U1Q18_002522, partial [Sarracenia purpurea var. burkii]
GHGKEVIHVSPCPSPSYAKVVSSGLVGGHRFVEGKIIQTGLRIGSSLEGIGCSGDKADRDFVYRPVEDLKATQNRRGKSKVAGCFRCAYLLLHWPIALVSVGCPMLEGPLSWWMSEMFFEFEAEEIPGFKRREVVISRFGTIPLFCCYFYLGKLLGYDISLGLGLAYVPFSWPWAYFVAEAGSSVGDIKAVCFSWLWRRLWRWLSSLNFWDHKDHCYVMNALSGQIYIGAALQLLHGPL